MSQMSIDCTRPKIGLFGIFGAGNLGNESTLRALLYNLRKHVPNADFTCICSGPEETALRYNISALRIREMSLPPIKNKTLRLLRRMVLGVPMELYRCLKAITTLRGVDMLVMTGTGMLGDFGIRPLDLHYDILRWSVIAKLCRCKLLFVSVGVGPIDHRLSKSLIKAALALADYRSYRDTFSKQYLESMNFDTKGDRVCPDLAFSLPREVAPSNHKRDGHGAVIGVGLMTYFNRRASSDKDETVYRDYIAKLGAFVIWLVEHKYIVRLLIGDTLYDARARQDLRCLLQKAGIDWDERKIIDEPACSLDELLSQLATTDLVVASRFHNVLLALMFTKLVVAISYHKKIDSLMADVGLPEFCQDIEHIDSYRLVEQFTSMRHSAEELKPQIERKTEEYRRELEDQYDRMITTFI